MRFSPIALVLTLASHPLLAGYTTPNTGINWTLDSLVAHSSGTVTGVFPHYTLNDTVTVSISDRLTIQAGSIISVASGVGKGFTVLGTLRAIGTVTDTIVVRGIIATQGSHRGFRFEDSSIDSACVISYCRIQDAVEGIHCLNSNLLISNSLFTNNSSNGVRCFGASPTINHCAFIQNYQSAITANVNSSPLIEHNLFARNNVQNTGARNQIAIGGQGTNNPVIRDNEIYNQSYFRAGGISLITLTSSDVCNAIVENNYIHDNSFGIVIQGLSPGGALHPIIRNNRIENNRINPDPLVSGSGITVQTGGPTNAPIITGNILAGNYWGVTVVSATGLTNSPKPGIGDLSNADTSDDGWNTFINNNNGGRIYQLYNNGTQDVSAQNNYWGSGDSVTVESYITHHPDSTAFGLVSYRPYGIPGLGKPDTFYVHQIDSSQVRLSWIFPAHTSQANIHLMFGADSSHLIPITTLPDTQTSYVMNFQSPLWYYGISSSNRFGFGDTVIRLSMAITPSVRQDGTQPSTFTLLQNYPNPFNPSTTITYEVPAASHVHLAIFNALGQSIATLVDQVQPAGRYLVHWRAEEHASGVYYYRLQADVQTMVKTLLIVK